MPAGIQLFLQTVFGLLFFTVLFAGIYIFKNFEKLFGPDPSIPSEGESSRAYTKAQVFLVWIHALFLTGGFALLVH